MDQITDLSPVETLSPVSEAAGGEERRETPEEGTALCLSGGGYRAMLFHLGALWRCNQVGLLPRLDRVSSVSGGSIAAGVLAMNWSKLGFEGGVGEGFDAHVTGPIRRLAGKTLDAGSIVGGILLPGSINDYIVKAYRRHLFGDATLQDLPETPRFVINATNVQSGALWRFSKPYLWDYRVGKVPRPDILLAVAVAASSAFPPVLSPATLELDEEQFEPGSGSDLQRPPYTTDVVLTDGGVYDNLGLETAWKRYATILVSDGGGKEEDDPEPAHDWARHSIRIIGLIDNQVRSLRKRQVIGSYRSKIRDGAYWGIRSDIANYQLPGTLDCPEEATLRLARTPTRLQRLEAEVQERLINWGYAICDAALRKHCAGVFRSRYGIDVTRPAPAFPYPAAGV